MPSSISSSEDQRTGTRPDGFTVALLLTIVVALAGTEAASILAFDRSSKVQRRVLAQRQALLEVKDAGRLAKSHVAVLGNSLLFNGVDVPLLTEKIEPKLLPVPYFVLGTEYFDWYFGLRRLFAEGMRPQSVVLGLSPSQLASSYTRGDYSARYLFQGSDLLEVARQTHMDLTRGSGFVLAHFSEFYSTREVIREFFLNKLLPSVSELLHSRLSAGRAPATDESVLRQLAIRRLSALDRLCRANSSHFVLVIPPSYETGAETIAQAGREAAVSVLLPVPSQEFDASYYQSDGYHLNDRGARIFTARLAESLLDEQAKLTPALRTSR